jgi:hypothetical protein
MRLEAVEATTFRELAAPAHRMIGGDRGACPLCAETPVVKRKEALPWGFWCVVHGLHRGPLGGEAIETLFSSVALAELDPLAPPGARRLADWAAGDGLGFQSWAFLATPHRRPSLRHLYEQPRLSLAARRAHRGFLRIPDRPPGASGLAGGPKAAGLHPFPLLCGGEGERRRRRQRPPASLKNSGLSCLINSDSESHKPCSKSEARALSLSNSSRPRPVSRRERATRRPAGGGPTIKLRTPLSAYRGF